MVHVLGRGDDRNALVKVYSDVRQSEVNWELTDKKNRQQSENRVRL